MWRRVHGYAGSGWTYVTGRSRLMLDCDGQAVTPNDDREARIACNKGVSSRWMAVLTMRTDLSVRTAIVRREVLGGLIHDYERQAP